MHNKFISDVKYFDRLEHDGLCYLVSHAGIVFPKRLKKTTLRHSHGKWKSPVYTWNCVCACTRRYEVGMVGKEERERGSDW